MGRRVAGLAWLALVLVGALSLPGCDTAEGDRRIAAAIRRQVAQPFRWFRRATVDDDDIQPLVRRFYRERRHRPAWTRLSGPTDDARELMKELEAAPEHGLQPDTYDASRVARSMEELGKPLAAASDQQPVRLAALDVALTRSFLKLALHRATGQVNPLQLPAEWHIRPEKLDAVAVLRTAVERHRVRDALAGLDPPDPQYARLREALVRYRGIAENGGWPAVPPGTTLRRGRSGPGVQALQRRLIASGDLGGSLASGRFDGATEAAVRSYQERHGFEPDGIVGAELIEQLNLPVGHRIRQIELNLERRRWVPDTLLRGRYVEVNVPAFQLAVVENGRPVMNMRVVVGKRFSPTPMFSDEISYVVFNPYWNVPPTIAAEEIVAEVQADPDYLRKNGMRVFENEGEGARELDPAEVDWSSMTPETFRYAIRQDPGPENAVGHVKFMCPNQYDVYLHDTPAGHLFDQRERGFSHGCIRVEQPLELAQYVLRGKPGWDGGRIAAAFDTSHNASVTLPEPLSVHIVYWTAYVDDHGRLQLRDDVYGLDRLLDRALRSRPASI